MLRKTMIILATVAALTGGLTADALARGGGGGGGGGHGGGFGAGAHMGGGFGAGHFGGPRAAFARGFAGQRFAGTRGHFDRSIRSGRGFRFFGPDWDYGAYDYGCGYGYPYYSPYGCYPYAY